MSDLSERFEKGRTVFAEDIGVERDQVMPQMSARVGTVFAEEAILAAGGPAWNDPGLPERDRSIVVLTALICQGVLGERLDAHLERAVRNGVDQHALEVMLVLLALYIGQARTSVAGEEIQKFFRARAGRDDEQQ